MHSRRMDIFGFNAAVFLSFLLTLMRVSLVVFLLPFYSGEYIPVMVKAAMSIVLTLALWPTLSFPGEAFPAHPLGIAVLVLAELALGLTLGMAVNFFLTAFQTGGQIVDFQMGFTMVSIADPTTGQQVSVTGQVLNTVSMMIFLALDGHLIILRALADSFALIPAGGIVFTPALSADMLTLSAQMFSLAVRIAAPVIAALFMTELALAIMGRAAPQMNLLTLGFPAKISVGFFFVTVLFTIIALYLEDFIVGLGPMLHNIMRLAR